MKKTYMSPNATVIDLFGEELMIVKASNEQTGASDALTNKKDFEETGVWSSENWTAQ